MRSLSVRRANIEASILETCDETELRVTLGEGRSYLACCARSSQREKLYTNRYEWALRESVECITPRMDTKKNRDLG